MMEFQKKITLLITGFSLLLLSASAVPAPAHYYPHQLVDHLSSDREESPYHGQQWSQRYYVSSDHFLGPGHPIFLIFGGEGAIEPKSGIYYPVVSNQLAKKFGAFVLQPEHRFYGFSQPILKDEYDSYNQVPVSAKRTLRSSSSSPKADPRVELFTAEQALMDAIRLVKHIAQEKLKCSPNRSSPDYCPVITVGGSYPGFLSAMARLLFPDSIDISYSASAPIKFYSQEVLDHEYYNYVTDVAEKTIPGCSAAVREALEIVYEHDKTQSDYIPALECGLCPGTLPGYILDRETFFQEVFMMVGYTFA